MTLTHKLFGLTGRITRADYWLCTLILFSVLVAVIALAGAALGIDAASPTDPRALGVQALAGLAMAWPSVAVGVKRLHDRGQSGWWFLASFIPVIGSLWMLLHLGLMKGEAHDNHYGAAPEPIVLAPLSGLFMGRA